MNLHAWNSAAFLEPLSLGQPGTLVCQIFFFITNLSRGDEVLLQIDVKLKYQLCKIIVKCVDSFFIPVI